MKRADPENGFDELKNQWGFRGYCRQRAVVTELAVKAQWWAVLKACYERRRTWWVSTAPQLEATGQMLRRLARQTTGNPEETLPQPAPS